ncbi:alpha/beta fold hydrolase [Chitinimonas taiwanensis]|uniref:PGAP1-like protein n=1 Tax=Chitinimonas taiwanensis DSM 18899 TaxID=1121279 RepID=A0A1K2H313_9NEIS|nr:alpha/beta fold hydrolase [Chitinimonas taiwanensis]SFZ70015.1 PGAP1-like protein [Chitinimonas taiwanensis DSM 18899]
MPTTPPKPPSAGYLPAAKAAFEQTAGQVEAMHRAIADKSFDTLQRVPVISVPVKLVRSVHDAVLGGAYGAVRLGGRGLLGLAGAIWRPKPSQQPASRLQSALNGAFGDALQADANPLAFEMALYAHGASEPLSRAALADALQAHNGKLCVLIHGLALDERCWQGEGAFGPRLQAEFGYLPVYLRYNSGLPIQANAAALAGYLEDSLAGLPGLHELVLVGHSMGGLLARSASYQASQQQLRWLGALRMVVCVGSPHRGAPLERIGRLLTVAMQVSKVSSPLAELAAQRSQGVQDLHHGLLDPISGQTEPLVAGVAYRLVASTMLRHPQQPAAQMLGDGLVPLRSATDPDLMGDVARVELGGIGHMGQLRHPAVYAALQQWLRSITPH